MHEIDFVARTRTHNWQRETKSKNNNKQNTQLNLTQPARFISQSIFFLLTHTVDDDGTSKYVKGS